MNHMLLGGSIPFLIALVYYLWRRGRASLPSLILTPLSMAVLMLWALAPDIPRFFGFTDMYLRLKFDPRCDIFFWHYSIDQVEKPAAWQPLLFVLMWALILFAAWRELKMRERES